MIQGLFMVYDFEEKELGHLDVSKEDKGEWEDKSKSDLAEDFSL